MSVKLKLNFVRNHFFLLRLFASYGGRIQVETSSFFFGEIISFFLSFLFENFCNDMCTLLNDAYKICHSSEIDLRYVVISAAL